ncbi:hypothetical protein N665_0055s0004 [Sinapis alba]|nr:hypothetical protein N665_0055s0004 [Sinapis alba]
MSVQHKDIGVPSAFAALSPPSIITSSTQETRDATPSETVFSPPVPAPMDPLLQVPVTSLNPPTEEHTTAPLSVGEPASEPVFVPAMSAWSKPLRFTPPPSPLDPASTPGFTEVVKGQISCFWPTISESIVKGHKHKKEQLAYQVHTTSQSPLEKLPPPVLKEDGSLRFPWAARMNQSSRNLFRAAEPTYRLDGTPQVIIPSKVLKLGPENKEEYIVGQFHRCSNPPGGLIHAVLNRLWGRECKISCRKLGESSYLFHIPHENTRKWVIQRGVWHVDDCLLFVAPWSPVDSLKIPEISTLPVWVTLKNIPDSCYSRLGSSHIASGLGEPMLTHKPRLDPTSMGEAKILVEIELDKPFPKLIALDDKQGNIYLVEVEYSWIPSACERCGALGHKEKRCLLPATTFGAVLATKEAPIPNEEVPMVDIEKLMQKSPATPATNLNQSPSSTLLHQAAETPKKSSPTSIHQVPETPKKSSPTINSEDHTAGSLSKEPKVHYFSRSKSDTTLPLLAVTVAVPSASHIMEETPSPVHIREASHTSEKEQPFGESFNQDSPHSQNIHQIHNENPLVFGNDKGVLLVGETSGYNLTRGGRPIKPTQKIQEMEWTTVRGKGKRGRRGRGNHYR